jgi:hypothetical protein
MYFVNLYWMVVLFSMSAGCVISGLIVDAFSPPHPVRIIIFLTGAIVGTVVGCHIVLWLDSRGSK